VAQAPLPNPKLCEVEFQGTVKYAGKLPPGHRWFVFAAQGDCLAKDAHILGFTPTNTPEGGFFGEVFSKWGADLTFCAAAAESHDKPSTLYGKATGTYHAEKTGEVEFKGLVLSPKPGPKKIFPAYRPALDSVAPPPK
jgi:hypothetical protein